MSLRAEKFVVSLALLAILGGGFFVVAAWSGSQTVPVPAWLVTRLDARIPVLPVFVWVYLSWYPATAFVLLADRETFRQAYVAYVVAFTVCVVGYVLLPIAIERPSVPSGAGPSASALAFLYAFDPPRNLFPSFHAAIAAILVRLAYRTRFATLVSGWFIALCAACVLTRQHYVLDVLAGIAVGSGALRVVDVPRTSIRSEARDKSRATALAATPSE